MLVQWDDHEAWAHTYRNSHDAETRRMLHLLRKSRAQPVVDELRKVFCPDAQTLAEVLNACWQGPFPLQPGPVQALQAKLQKLLATWFYKQRLPFQALLDPGFREFVDALVMAGRSGLPAFESPTMNAFQGSILDEVHEESLEKMSAAITDARKEWRPLSMAVDVHEHVVNFRVVDAAKKRTYFYTSFSIDNPTSEHLCNLASNVLDDLDDRFSKEEALVIRSIILNNVADVKNSGELMERRNLFYWSIPCQSEAMNLILTSWCKLRFIRTHLKLAASIAAFVRSHPRVLELYQQMNSCSKELIGSSRTRCSRDYLVLARLLEAREAIIQVFKDPGYKNWLAMQEMKVKELGSDCEEAVLSTGFWEKVKAIKEVLGPLFLATRLFAAPFPSIGYVWQAWETLKKTTREVTGLSVQQQELLMQSLVELEGEYFNSCKLFGAAHALNPRVPLGQVPQEAIAQLHQAGAKLYSAGSPLYRAFVRQYDDYLMCRGLFHEGGEADVQFTSEDPDLYAVWIACGELEAEAPELWGVACEVMGMSASNSAAHGAHTTKRNNLTKDRVQKLVCIYENNRHLKRSFAEELRRTRAAEQAAWQLFDETAAAAGDEGFGGESSDEYSDEECSENSDGGSDRSDSCEQQRSEEDDDDSDDENY